MDDVLSWLPSWLNHQPEKSVFCPHDLGVIPPGFIILLFFEHVLLLKNNELIISDGKRHGLNHVKPPFLLARSPNMSALLRGQLPFSSVSPAAEVQKVPFWSVGRPGFVGYISYFSIFFLGTVLFLANLFLMIGPSPWDPEIFQPRWSHLPRIGRWIWQDLPAPALNSERVQRSSLVVGWLFDFRLWPSGQIS